MPNITYNFYEGIIPTNVSLSDANKMRPCNVFIENGILNINCFSKLSKSIKKGSFSTKLNEIEIVEKKYIFVNISGIALMNVPAIVLKDSSSTFTILNGENSTDKKTIGNKAQAADLDEIIAAINSSKKTSQINSESSSEINEADDVTHTTFDKKTKFALNKNLKILIGIVCVLWIAMFLFLAFLGNDNNSDSNDDNMISGIYDDNDNGRYDAEDVFGENYKGWIDFADSLD